MTSNYEVGTHVVVDFEDSGRETCEVMDVTIDMDANAIAYFVADQNDDGFWVQPESILCASADFDGELNNVTVAEFPLTLKDILKQMREEAEDRLEESEKSVEFETQLLADIGVVLESL